MTVSSIGPKRGADCERGAERERTKVSRLVIAQDGALFRAAASLLGFEVLAGPKKPLDWPWPEEGPEEGRGGKLREAERKIELSEKARGFKKVVLAYPPGEDFEALCWRLSLSLGLSCPGRARAWSLEPGCLKEAIEDAGPVDLALAERFEARGELARALSWPASKILSRRLGLPWPSGLLAPSVLETLRRREASPKPSGGAYKARLSLSLPESWGAGPEAEAELSLSSSPGRPASSKASEALSLSEVRIVAACAPPLFDSFEPQVLGLVTAAEKRLGFSPLETMELAVALYGRGLITWPMGDLPASPGPAPVRAGSVLSIAKPQGLGPALSLEKGRGLVSDGVFQVIDEGRAVERNGAFPPLGARERDMLELMLEREAEAIGLRKSAEGTTALVLSDDAGRLVFSSEIRLKEAPSPFKAADIFEGARLKVLSARLERVYDSAPGGLTPGGLTAGGLAREVCLKGLGGPQAAVLAVNKLIGQKLIAQRRGALYLTSSGRRLAGAVKGRLSLADPDHARDVEARLGRLPGPGRKPGGFPSAREALVAGEAALLKAELGRLEIEEAPKKGLWPLERPWPREEAGTRPKRRWKSAWPGPYPLSKAARLGRSGVFNKI
ncbi:MAG: hypothetical protein LBE49_08350 [Deltaproteobacteria bacterium]|jgi:hypothetical protein|nr:hypothetical protein [Deltaproteobacteria bacterium]